MKTTLKGEAWSGEFTVRRRDSSTFPVFVQDIPVLDEEGEIAGIVGISTDITERKQAEQMAFESQSRIRRLIESDIIGIIVADLNGKFLEVNNAFLKITGYSREDFLDGKLDWMKMTPPEYRRLDNEALEELFTTGSCAPHEKEYIRKDGNRVPVTIGAALWDTTADAPSWVAFVLDVTERKQAGEEHERLLAHLRKSARRLVAERDVLHTVMENTGAQLAYLDSQFNFVIANSSYVRACGHSEEELIGKNHFDLFPNEENQAIFEKVRDTGIPAQFHDKPFVFADQPERGVTYWDWTLTPVKDSSDKIQGLVFSLMETTERVRAEERLRTYERLATLGELAGSISHELRNPLGVIDSSVFYLQNRLKRSGGEATLSDEKLQAHLERIRSSVAQSTGIITSLLNLTQMHEPRLERLDLKAVTADVISVSHIPPTIKVTLDFPRQEVAVKGDGEQLRLAFQNIVRNAIQAMKDSGNLTVAISRQNDTAELSFSDNGPGIPLENLDRVFLPLFTTRAKGIGFGLPIAKLVVERHGGTIQAHPAAGTGATILVSLPLAEEPQARAE